MTHKMSHKDFLQKRGRRGDSDSGIHSFGSTSSRLDMLNKSFQSSIDNHQNEKIHTWRDSLLEDIEIFSDLADFRRMKHYTSSRSKSQDERRSKTRKNTINRAIVDDHDYGNLGSGTVYDTSRKKSLTKSDRRSRSCTTSSRGNMSVSVKDQIYLHQSSHQDLGGGSQIRSKVTNKRLSLISSCHHIPRVLLPSSSTASSSLQVTSSSSLSQSDPDISSSSLDEDSISLAFIRTSAIIHKYVASRGQRERETEIYEMLPTMIPLSKNVNKNSLKKKCINSSKLFNSHKRSSINYLIMS